MQLCTLHPQLQDPELLQIGTLPPRATLIPASKKDVYFKNKEESQLLQSLNGLYRFAYREKDCFPDFFSPSFDCSAWDTIDVPSMWQYRGYSKPLYPNVDYPIPFHPPYVACENPVGYYRKTFSATKAGRTVLYFGGVDNACFVYLNGSFVGFSKGSRLPAEYDVTELIREGENLLCVKVFTYSDATYLENQDMLLANGIFRDVFLIQTDPVSLWDYEIRTEKNRLFLDITLWDGDYTGCSLQVEVAGQTQCQPASKQLQLSFTVADVQYWNAEMPHLYPLYITLLREHTVLEIHSKKVGFRQARIDGNRLLLNDAPITLKGICRHEHNAKNGRAITVAQIEQELRLIKDHNLNAIRCAHYPNNPAFYEIAAELGIYVMDEGDLESHGCRAVKDLGFLAKQPLWKKAFLNRTQRMVERDKNECCIIIWSVGNEHGKGENIDDCLRYIRRRLPGALVFHTDDNARDPDICDFRANGYFTMASLKSYPPEGAPVLLLEYGHAMGNSPGLMEDTWDYVYRNRHIPGGYLWEFKSHGFYREDGEGKPFYQYGGDFDDLNHWSNFSIDGYCLSDGTPKPSLRDCKNVLSPCYVTWKNGKLQLMNTNDFRPLDYVRMNWELREDYTVLESGTMQLPAIAPYCSYELPFSTELPRQTPGASYFLHFHFSDEAGRQIGVKQVCLWKVPAECYPAQKPEATVSVQGADVAVEGEIFCIRLKNGLLAHYSKDGKVLLDKPMKLNFYRAPIDNDGIVNFAPRWIGKWDAVFLKHFRFYPEAIDTGEETDCVRISVHGKVLPTSVYAGFTVCLTYRIYRDGLVLIEYMGEPYGKLPEVLPRIGIALELEDGYDRVCWYGRGEEENYCDRKAHCPMGLYALPVEQMNFLYDIPQECGTRTDTAFTILQSKGKALSVIGADSFSFSCHDFSLEALEKARHRNELVKDGKTHLYIDYKMRGLGSHSCGPNPEECYELRPHSFRFVFGLWDTADPDAALQLYRHRFCVQTQALSDTHQFREARQIAGIIECDINRD